MNNRPHDTDENYGSCWCDPIITDQLDGKRVITHRPPATHTVPSE